MLPIIRWKKIKQKGFAQYQVDSIVGYRIAITFKCHIVSTFIITYGPQKGANCAFEVPIAPKIMEKELSPKKAVGCILRCQLLLRGRGGGIHVLN